MITFYFILPFAFGSCSDNQNNHYYYPFESALCSCTPIVKQVKGYNFYIPNAFTPNHDGINDMFYINSDCHDCEILGIYIFNTKNHNSFFTKTFKKMYKGTPNNPVDGWNGTQSGVYIYGDFNYIFEILFPDGEIKNFAGKASALPCFSGSSASKNETKCKFGTQHDGNGGYGKFIPTGEKCN